MRLKFVVSLIVICLIFIFLINIVSAYYSDPNGDIQKQWSIYPTSPSSHYDKIDDGIRQPNTPNKQDYIYGIGNIKDKLKMSIVSGYVTKIRVWIYGKSNGAAIVLGVEDGAGFSNTGSFQLTTEKWYSLDFDVNRNLNNLYISIEPFPFGPGLISNIYAIYAEITSNIPQQEICDNGIDDDLDYMKDCEDSECSCKSCRSFDSWNYPGYCSYEKKSCYNDIDADGFAPIEGTGVCLNDCNEAKPGVCSEVVCCTDFSNIRWVRNISICRSYGGSIVDDKNCFKNLGEKSKYEFMCTNNRDIYYNCGTCINPGEQENCTDNIDNNCNGKIDCDDESCVNAPDCLGQPEICDGIDNDKDGLIDEDFDLDKDGITSCLGDCNDNPLDDSGICWNYIPDEERTIEKYLQMKDSIICPNTNNPRQDAKIYYSVCSKCINPGMKEVCDGIDNDCKGHCEGGTGILQCNIENWNGVGIGDYSADCTIGSNAHGPLGGENGKGFCQMADDYINIDYDEEIEVKGLEQCVLYGEYAEENIQDVSGIPNLIEENGEYYYDLGGGNGPQVSADERWVFKPASSGENALCHHGYVFETVNYESLSGWGGMLEADGWKVLECIGEPLTFGRECKYKKEEIVESCLPISERIKSYEPDGGNTRGFNDFFVKDNTGTIYPDKEIMKTIEWKINVDKKDKCTDSLDNDGEENLLDVLSTYYNIENPELQIELIPACCNYGESFGWHYARYCLERGGEIENDDACVNAGLNLEDKPVALEIKQTDTALLQLKDLDDMDCYDAGKYDYENERIIEYGYGLDDDNDKYFGCIRKILSRNPLVLEQSSCDDSKMGISGYSENGEPVGFLKPSLFPDCDDYKGDDSLSEAQGGYKLWISGVARDIPISYFENGQLKRDSLKAELVHPFQQQVLPAIITREDAISSGCIENVMYKDVNCNVGWANKEAGRGYSLSGLWINGVSPFDFDRTTGLENYACGDNDKADYFCLANSPLSVGINYFMEKEAPRILGQTALLIGGGYLFLGLPGIIQVAGMITIGGISGNHLIKNRGAFAECMEDIENVLNWNPEKAETCWRLFADAGVVFLSGVGVASKGLESINSLTLHGKMPDGAYMTELLYKNNLLYKAFRIEGISTKSGFLYGLGQNQQGNFLGIAWARGTSARGYAARIPEFVYNFLTQSAPKPVALLPAGSANYPVRIVSPFSSSQATIASNFIPLAASSTCQPVCSRFIDNLGKLPSSRISLDGRVKTSIINELEDELLNTGNSILTKQVAECLGLKCVPPISFEQGCFLAETPILLANGSYKNIEDIKENDRVMAYDLESKKKVPVNVTKTFTREVKEYLIINYTFEK